MVRTQSEVGTLFDTRSEAIWTKDIEGLMSLYSPDIVTSPTFLFHARR